MRQTVYLFAVFIAAMISTGCVIQPVNEQQLRSAPIVGETGSMETPTPADAMATAVGAYKLKPLDPIFIRFSGIMEQQTLEQVIDEKGEISLLHIAEPIMAAGLTTSQLEKKIETLYVDGGIYKNVSVNVTMTAKVYYVQGEVNQPGQFQLTSGTTLLQAIAGARGFTPFASKKVTITRQGKIYTFNWKKLERDPSQDVKIEAGDVVKVWQTWY